MSPDRTQLGFNVLVWNVETEPGSRFTQPQFLLSAPGFLDGFSCVRRRAFLPQTGIRSMSSTTYEIVSQAEDEIVVRDTATGHVFTFTVRANLLAGRLLSEAKYVTSESSKVRPEDVVRFAWNFAQIQMKQAGKIDRVIIR